MKLLDNKYYKFSLIASMAFLLLFTACEKDDDTNIDADQIQLLSFGPSPALRGGELIFIGTNLDQVSAITLPSNIKVTSFTTKTADKITLTIPEETVDGFVVLETPQGEITSKSQLTISEPITIASISPAEARPGETISISGTYLNLVKEVIFMDKKSVLGTDFISQTKDKLEVAIPLDAQTGPIQVSNGEAEPIIVSSTQELIVTLPTITSFSPTPVKAGSTITLTGTHLDLVQEVIFGGNNKVEEFTTTATEMSLLVPATAKDGALKLKVASLLEVSSEEEVILTVPTITELAPNPVKPGQNVTITGADLDLVTSIVFGGEVVGTIVSQELTQLVATVPLTATSGVVSLNMASDKTVTSGTMLNLIEPVISAIGPTEIKSNADLTITGTHLDLVTDITFAGGITVSPASISADEIVVTVPPGSENGPIVLTTTNGSQITSSESLTILASNVPLITGYPEIAKPGNLLVLTGEKLDLLTDVIFPENVLATQFGVKTASMIEVVVPEDVQRGIGVITFVTFEGETTTSPPINFQGVDAVTNESLVFFDFNGTGAKDSWWGNVMIVNDDNSLDGSSYGLLNGNFSGWTDLFWRNGNNNFPGEAINTNVSDFVLKLDINIIEPITAGNLKLRLNTSEGDYWWALGPAAPRGDGSNVDASGGWITITVDISEFRDNFGWGDNSPTDLSDVPNEFGMAFDNGDAYINVLIDNVRFEQKQ